MQVTLSESAEKELNAFFNSNADTKKSVRIFLAPGGCCGPSISMALDEADGDDVTAEAAGISFCMTKELFEKVGDVSVDLGYMGFQLVTERPFAVPGQGDGSCSSCGGCSGCH